MIKAQGRKNVFYKTAVPIRTENPFDPEYNLEYFEIKTWLKENTPSLRVFGCDDELSVWIATFDSYKDALAFELRWA